MTMITGGTAGLVPNARVRITWAQGVDAALNGHTGTLLGYTRPHGWARVRLDQRPGQWPAVLDGVALLHPEALDVLPAQPDGRQVPRG
jgi:hypothetical protein